MDDMKNYGSWVRDVDDINDVVLWAQGFRFYEQVKVVDDMNDSRSHELRPLDAMNNLGL